MGEICGQCGLQMVEPAEHEFCWVSPLKRFEVPAHNYSLRRPLDVKKLAAIKPKPVFLKAPEIPVGDASPHYPGVAEQRTQGKIKHYFAPKGGRLPIRHKDKESGYEDGAVAYERRIVEDMQ